MQIEDDLEAGQSKKITVINLGKLGGLPLQKEAHEESKYQEMEKHSKDMQQYKFSQKVLDQQNQIDSKDFNAWVEKIANN